MSRERQRLELLKTALAIGIVLLLITVGCSTHDAADIPYALSAPGARLALTVRMPAAAVPSKVNGHAAATPFPAGVASLEIDIGNVTAADFRSRSFTQLSTPTGQTQEVVVANVPPGRAKRVHVKAKDASGRIIASAIFYIDFFPGMLSSNDVDLGVPGGPQGSGQTTSTTPPIPATYVVTEFGGNRLSLVTPSTGTRTVLPLTSPAPSGPRGVVIDRVNGDFVYTNYASGDIVRVDKTTYAQTTIASGLAGATGISQVSTGSFVVGANSGGIGYLYIVGRLGGSAILLDSKLSHTIQGVTVAPDGRTYFTAPGSPNNETWFRAPTSTLFYTHALNDGPVGVAYNTDLNEVIVSENNPALSRLIRIGTSTTPGTFIAILRSFTDSAETPQLIAWDPITKQVILPQPQVDRLTLISPTTGFDQASFGGFPAGSEPTGAARVQ